MSFTLKFPITIIGAAGGGVTTCCTGGVEGVICITDGVV